MTYSLGDNLRRLRSIKNLTQKELSILTGVSISAISKIELNKSIPALSTLLKISTAVDVPMDYFLNIEDRSHQILTAYIYHRYIKKELSKDENRDLAVILNQTFN